MQFLPPLTLNAERPQVIQLFRIVVLTTEHKHVGGVEHGRVTGSRARLVLPLVHLASCPSVTVDTVNADIVCAEPILKTTENDHLTLVLVHDGGMLIPRHDDVSFALGRLPRHIRQHQLVNNAVIGGGGACLQPRCAFVVVVATEDVC